MFLSLQGNKDMNEQKQIKDKTLSRLAAIQALHSYENRDESDVDASLSDVLSYYINYNPLEEYDLSENHEIKLVDKSLLTKLIKTSVANMHEIDKVIASLLVKQNDIAQVNSVARAILRAAVCELLFFTTPYKVVINEYVTISSDFFEIPEVNFINGILDKAATAKKTSNLEPLSPKE